MTRGALRPRLGALDDAYRLDVLPAEHLGTALTDRLLLLYFTLDHQQAQAGRAHPGVLSGGPPHDDVLARSGNG